jgi:hypothetical protein
MGLFAVGQVKSGVGPTYNLNRGFLGVVRNGAGDYTLTLQDGLNVGFNAAGVEGYAKAYCAAAGIAQCNIIQPSLTTLQVRTFNAAGAATDGDFNVEVSNIGPQ